MRRGLKLLLSFSILAGSVQQAVAAQFSGDYLLSMCAVDQAGKEIVPGGGIACQAYIAGVLDYHNILRSMGTAPSVDFCVPDNVTMNQLQGVVGRYIYINRNQHGSFTAAPAVALALFSAYPCKKK